MKKRILSVLFMLAGIPHSPAHSFPSSTEVLSSGGNRIVLAFEFAEPRIEGIRLDGRSYRLAQVEGCDLLADEGRPQVPVRGVLVGIPFGVNPRVHVLEVETGGRFRGLRVPPAPSYERADDGEFARLVPRYREDAGFFPGGVFPEDWASAGWVGALRFQQVVQLSVFPVRIGSGGDGEWASRVTVEVEWDGGFDEKRSAPALDEPRWEAVYGRAIVNAQEARAWRRSPAAPFPLKDTPAREEEYSLSVGRTGLYEVRYEDLPGFSGPVPLDELGIYRKVYSETGAAPWDEVRAPVHFVDEDGDARYGPGDRLYFWGVDFRDAFVRYGYEDRYAGENVYWLGRGPAGGATMDTLAAWEGAVAGTLATFPEGFHFEEELFYEWDPAGSDRDGLPPESDAEQWFWTYWKVPEAELPITSYGCHPDSLPRVRARFKGAQVGTHTITLHLSNGMEQTTAADSFAFNNLLEYIYESPSLAPADFLTDGENSFDYRGRWASGSTQGEGAGAFLDWVELEYARIPIAVDDYLYFNSGRHTGAWAVEVRGFGDDGIRLFDVSDPLSPKWVSPAAGSVREADGPGESGYRLVFSDSLSGQKRWAAVAEGGALRFSQDQIRRDTPSALHSSEADYVIITDPLFFDGIRPLAERREAQGYRVRAADIADVYDEFSGGIKDPVAIRRYLQWGFEHWSVKPAFVLLVGDASEDHRGVYPSSGKDWVPSISSNNFDELAAMDNWFVRFDGDPLLDACIGRLPAGSESELEAMVEKILDYEDFSPGDAWRGRVFLLSDDRCSGSSPYACERLSEEIFEETTALAAGIVRGSQGVPLDVREMYLRDYTGQTAEDGYHRHCLGGSVTDPLRCVRDSVYKNVTPMLFDILNEGVLLFGFQGHGNRKVLFDEYALADSVTFGGAWRADVNTRAANSGRPFIAQGFGCHFGDFDEVREDDPSTQDCLLEKLLFQRGRGAVAALGSTGLETLPASSAYEEYLYRAFFDTPPASPAPPDGDGAPGARWLLGEIQAASIALLAGTPQSGSFLWRYTLFGDPAMVIDALPPGMSATVDGDPVAGGQVIAGGDTSIVNIRIRVGDEVAIDSTSISAGILEGGALTPLEADRDFRITREGSPEDGAPEDGRVFFIEYAHELRLANYDLVFSARDRNGRSVTLNLGVRYASQVWFNGRVAVAGSRASPGASAVLEISLPRVVSAEALSLRARGSGGDVALPADAENLDGEGRRWRLSFSLETFEPGRYDLYLTAASMERALLSFEIARRLRVDNVTAYPNPFDRETGVWFVLSRDAAVRIRIFTVAGRRIRVLNAEGAADHNYVPWDGRDGDGEFVANGTYLFQVTATSGEEVVTSDIGKIVRMK